MVDEALLEWEKAQELQEIANVEVKEGIMAYAYVPESIEDQEILEENQVDGQSEEGGYLLKYETKISSDEEDDGDASMKSASLCVEEDGPSCALDEAIEEALLWN